MPEHLIVDPFHLELAGATLRSQTLPEPPPPLAATGSDAVSEAINVTMPMIEAPVTEGLPAAQAAITATGSKIAAAARRYAETDQKLGDQLNRSQFTGAKDKSATPPPSSAYSAARAPEPGGGPQLSSAPPPAPEQLPHSAASGSSVPDPGFAGGAAPPTSEAPEDAFSPGPWAGPADPEPGNGLDSGAWDAPADPDAAAGAIKPASVDTSTDAGDVSADQDASGDPQNPGDQAIPGGPGADEGPGADDGPETVDGPGTGNAPGTPDESEPGIQNGPGPATADGSKPPGDPRTAPDPAAQKDRPASSPPRGGSGRGLFSVSQAGAGAGGRGIPQSLAGSPKPPIAPLRPATAHSAPAHHPPLAPPPAHDQPARPMPVAPPAAHTPLSPAAPASPLTPATPHGPPAPAIPHTPPTSAAPDPGGGATGPPAPTPPTTVPSPPASPGTSPVATDPASDSGSKPASASAATPPAPRTRDAVMASIPVSPARAERDAVAEAATADASRRDGVDPLLLARRIAAALNVPGSDDEGDFGFFWVTAVTTEGAIVLANSYGIAYIPDGVRLPDPVYLASADDGVPVADRASWATYPVIAVQGWAQHHGYELRAVIATEEQLADSAPGVEKFALQPDDIPDSGVMIGRSRLEVVDPQAAEWLAAVPDESLRDRLPPAPADVTPPAEDEGMLWFEVMEPMFSTYTGREDAHLRAFHAYASQAEQLALQVAHRRVDPDTRRSAIADWLYWKHLASLHDAALNDPAYRRRTAGLYDESSAARD
ncbi:hypothetical protein [Mycobacterium sp. pR1184]|uniref:hypothetical protein n=1 Tax=Mycobacterium sp. pR1184 TaxID=3238981 RepID=UPI00351B4013